VNWRFDVSRRFGKYREKRPKLDSSYLTVRLSVRETTAGIFMKFLSEVFFENPSKDSRLITI
jgi:hypothetical protein